MQTQTPSVQPGRILQKPCQGDVTRIALDESELAARWRLSVKTLRRWRQEHLGPAFCKLGARVIYLLSEIEAYERRCSRYTVGARVSA